MIPLHRLAQLPRSQRLRKSAKMIGETERRLIVAGKLAAGEQEYLANVMALLAGDEQFSAAAVQAVANARSGLAGGEGGAGEIRRALNTVYHILLAETGRYPSDWDFIAASGELDSTQRRSFPGMQVYFEDIRSPFNVGSMFRSAESFGAEKIWLSPLCADPLHKRAERTAMGCVKLLPWERFSHEPFPPAEAPAADASPQPFSAGPFFALETGGTPLADFQFPAHGIMIAGSEELGVSPPALAAADASFGRVSIPLYGAKGSLNVSVAFGIVMQAWAAALAEAKAG